MCNSTQLILIKKRRKIQTKQFFKTLFGHKATAYKNETHLLTIIYYNQLLFGVKYDDRTNLNHLWDGKKAKLQ